MLKISMITEMNKGQDITQDMECPRSLLKIYMGRIVSADYNLLWSVNLLLSSLTTHHLCIGVLVFSQGFAKYNTLMNFTWIFHWPWLKLIITQHRFNFKLNVQSGHSFTEININLRTPLFAIYSTQEPQRGAGATQ